MEETRGSKDLKVRSVPTLFSLLLANIALNGIESIHRYKDAGYQVREPSVRYADDMVIILRAQDNAEEILKRISQFLAERGLNVSEKKTKLTATTNGFDFLGWVRLVLATGKATKPQIASLEKISRELSLSCRLNSYRCNDHLKASWIGKRLVLKCLKLREMGIN